MKLSSPWMQYVNLITAMFEQDPKIKVEYDEDKLELKLFVEGTDKANALTELLPSQKTFGNVMLKITVVPANITSNKANLIVQALEGNKAFKYAKTIQGPMSNPMTYVVLQRTVVQYFNDNLGDISGLRSTLYQEMADEVFENHDGVFFCTEAEIPW